MALEKNPWITSDELGADQRKIQERSLKDTVDFPNRIENSLKLVANSNMKGRFSTQNITRLVQLLSLAWDLTGLMFPWLQKVTVSKQKYIENKRVVYERRAQIRMIN